MKFIILGLTLLMTNSGVLGTKTASTSAASESNDVISCLQSGIQSGITSERNKQVPAVYVQQWEGDFSNAEILQALFQKSSKNWNDSFSHLSGIHNHNFQAFCPWSYTTDFDEKRIPQFLPKVKCHCLNCLDNNGQARVDLRCTPINYNFLVLKQEGVGCFLGRKSYTPVYIKMPVACTCLRNARPARNPANTAKP